MNFITRMVAFASLVVSPLIGVDYYIKDLDALLNETSISNSINNHNIAVGSFKNGSKKRDFIWDNQNGLSCIPLEETPLYQRPFINDNNEVVGLYWHRTDYWFSTNECRKHIYIMSADGAIKDIGWPEKWTNKSMASWQTPNFWDDKEFMIVAFNNRGDILLANSVESKKISEHAVWSNGSYHYIPNSVLHRVYAINNKGQIIGRKLIKDENGASIPKLVLYDLQSEQTQVIFNDVDTLKVDLNDKDEVVFTQFISPKELKGYYWNPVNGLQVYNSFSPFAINNKGEMIGLKIDNLEGSEHFIFYHFANGNLTNLKEHLKIGQTDSMWSKIQIVCDINDQGWIVGQGVTNDQTQALVIIPKDHAN